MEGGEEEASQVGKDLLVEAVMESVRFERNGECAVGIRSGKSSGGSAHGLQGVEGCAKAGEPRGVDVVGRSDDVTDEDIETVYDDGHGVPSATRVWWSATAS